MRILRGRFCVLSVLWALLLLLVTSTSAFAAGTPVASGNNTINLTINPGNITGSVGTATQPAAVTLSGSIQTTTYTIPVTVTDFRGLGVVNSGWNVNITSTQFTTGGATPATLPTTASTVTGVAVTCTTAPFCLNPTNSITYPVTVPAGSAAPAAVEFYNAQTNTGLGSFSIIPTIAIAVPPITTTGTYSSVVTVAIVTGP